MMTDEGACVSAVETADIPTRNTEVVNMEQTSVQPEIPEEIFLPI